MVLKHDEHVYSIHPVSEKGPMCMVNWWQLFDLKKNPKRVPILFIRLIVVVYQYAFHKEN